MYRTLRREVENSNSGRMNTRCSRLDSGGEKYMLNKYILKNGKPVLEPDVIKWATWFETSNKSRIVAKTYLERGDHEIEISTVFLGLDHQFGKGPPLLYETMVFGGPDDEAQERTPTKQLALKAHKHWVNKQLKSGAKKEKEVINK